MEQHDLGTLAPGKSDLQTQGGSQVPQLSPPPIFCLYSRFKEGTLTCSEGLETRPSGCWEEVLAGEVWSVRLFLKRQAWI